MTLLQQSGIEIDLPAGWEGRIYTRTSTGSPVAVPTDSSSPSSPSEPGPEQTRPVLHAANFGLPREVGDYGSGAVEQMGNGHVFVAVIDFGPEAANTALFAAQEIPRQLRTDEFDPMTLQRPLPGQSGVQQFFTAAGRGFSLYAVLGAHLFRVRYVPVINDALRTLRIT